MSDIDAREFRNAMGAFATGITVVTSTDHQSKPIALTVNSFASVSLDPPLVLWSVNRAHDIAEDFVESDHFAVHILQHDQKNFSQHFSGDRPDKFEGIDYDTGIGKLPLLCDYCARFQCKVEHRYEGGDHVILVGRVLDMDYRSVDPIIFHAGKYRRLA